LLRFRARSCAVGDVQSVDPRLTAARRSRDGDAVIDRPTAVVARSRSSTSPPRTGLPAHVPLELDWILVRELEARCPAVVRAVGAYGMYLSDHEPVPVSVRLCYAGVVTGEPPSECRHQSFEGR